MCSSTLSLASPLMGADGQRHVLAALPPVSILEEAEWAQGPVRTGAGNLALSGVRSLDRSAETL
jgi:hypothetical protein